MLVIFLSYKIYAFICPVSLILNLYATLRCPVIFLANQLFLYFNNIGSTQNAI